MRKPLPDAVRCSGRLYNLIILIADYLAFFSVVVLALYIYKLCGARYSMRVVWKLAWFPVFALLVNSVSRLYGGSIFYPGLGVNPVEELKRQTLGIISAYTVLFAWLSVTRTSEAYSRLALLLSLPAVMLIAPAARRLTGRICRRLGIYRARILIAGADADGRRLARELRRDIYLNVNVAGFLDDSRTGPQILGRLEDYAAVAAKYRLNYLATALPEAGRQEWSRKFLEVFRHLLVVNVRAGSSVLCSYPVAMGKTGGLEICNRLRMPICRIIKLVTEILLALIILPLIFPLCLLIALLVKLTSRGPVFYRASRLGLNGKKIRVLKFRTMYLDADRKLEQLLEENPVLKMEWRRRFKLKNDPRITPLGAFLRRTSLDELPQFWNVLMGEMAIIGPRPIVTDEISYYGPDFQVFSMVKPGITGLWQVSGRNAVDYRTRVTLDVYYVNNWSVWLDYHIFLRTIAAVLLRRGAE